MPRGPLGCGAAPTLGGSGGGGLSAANACLGGGSVGHPQRRRKNLGASSLAVGTGRNIHVIITSKDAY